MNVLFATPYNNNPGGINQWAKHIINFYNSINSNIELDILPMSDPKGSDRSISHSKIDRLQYGIRTYLRVIKNLKFVSKQKKYDVLHIASSASISLIKDIWMANIAKRSGIKSVLHFHFGRIPELAEQKNWEWKLLKRAINAVNKCVVIDNKSYTTLLKHGFNNIALLPNPLAPNVEQIIKQNQDYKRDNNTILFVGHCVPTKGIYELGEACNKLKNIKLKLIGPIHNGIKAELISKTNNAEWLEIKGACDFEYVITEMLQCSIFVLPTYTEGFPNVIIESMACGCAIITTPVGAIPEMLDINGEAPCGICIAPRDVEQLRVAIEELISDDDKKRVIGQRAKKRVAEQYSINNIWKQLVNIWENC